MFNVKFPSFRRESALPKISSPESNTESNKGGLNVEKLKNNDLAIMVLNQMGFNVSCIEDLRFNDVNGTDLGPVVAITGAGFGSAVVSLEEFLNQKGLYPNHMILMGDLKIYPNYEDVLRKSNEKTDEVVAENPFSSLGTLFDAVRASTKDISADSFVVENSKTGIKQLFPKRFAEGFYNLATHLQVLFFNGALEEKLRSNNYDEERLARILEKGREVSTGRHEMSSYLNDLMEQRRSSLDTLSLGN